MSDLPNTISTSFGADSVIVSSGTTATPSGGTVMGDPTAYLEIDSGATLIDGTGITGGQGTINNSSGAVFSLSGSTGSVSVGSFVNAGEIDSNGTAGIAGAFSDTGTLNVQSGLLALSGGGTINGSGLTVASGATLAVGGGGGDTYTINPGTATVATSQGELLNTVGTTLTLTDGVTIATGLLTNDGVLISSFPNGSTQSETQTINANFQNSATFLIQAGGLAVNTVKLTGGGSSTGTVTVSAGTVLEFGTTLNAAYTITGTYNDLGATWVDASTLVTFGAGTAVNVTNFANILGTLDLSQATLSGTFQNLTVGGTLLLPGTPVTINGFNLSGTLSSSGTVTLQGAFSGFGVPVATLGGTLTGNGGTVILQPFSQPYQVSSTLTLAGGKTLDNKATLKVTSAGVLSDGNAGDTLQNDGTLSFSPGSDTISTHSLVNSGTLIVPTGVSSTTAIIAAALSGTGSITVGSNATLDLSQGSAASTLDNVSVTGTLSLGSNNVTIDGFSLGGTLSDSGTVTLQGEVGNANLSGTLTGGGTVVFEPFGSSYNLASALTLGANETLVNSGGSLSLSTGGINGNAGGDVLNNNAGGTLTFSPGSTSLQVAQLVNAGTIVAPSGSAVSIAAAVSNTNTGLIDVKDGGLLTLQQAVSGSGTLEIDGTGTLDLASTVNAGTVVGFLGTGGKLDLESPASFNGQIQGFILGSAIDLTKTQATSASFSNGTLTVTNGSSTVAALNLAGNYDAYDFLVQSDGSTGSYITLQPKNVAVSTRAYIGEVVLSKDPVSFGGANFDSSFVADVRIVYTTSIGSLTPQGTFGFNARSSSTVDSGTGVAYSGAYQLSYQAFNLPSDAGLATSVSFTAFIPTALPGGNTVALNNTALNFTSASATVLSGTAQANFAVNSGTPPTALTSPFTLHLVSTADDFNNDGVSDILARNASTGHTFVYPVTGGVVGGAIDLGAMSNAWSIAAAADFNGDATSDILWRNGTTGATAINIMQGGTVASTVQLGTIGTGWSVVKTGDFNGDGTSDILWCNTANHDYVIFNMVGGTVSSSSDLGIIGSLWSVVGVGDFEGNGTSDLLWRNAATGDALIFNMHNSSIVSSVDLGIVSTAWIVAGVGDFNGDGTADVLWRNTVTGSDVIYVINQDQIAGSINIGAKATGWSVVEIGDFNGDGTSDILWQNSTTGVLDAWGMNNGTVASDTTVSSLSGLGLTIVGSPQSITSSVPPVQAKPFADFNGDNISDILWRNASNGDAVVFLMSAGTVASSVDLGPIGSAWTIAALGDFNGDGTSDILWRNTATSSDVIFSIHNGSIASTTDIGVVGTAWSIVAVGDFNGDGTSDILWRNASTGADVIYNMSGGTVASATDIGVISSAWKVVGSGDFNGDGTTDLLWRNTATGDTVIFDLSHSSISSTADLGITSTAWSIAGIGDFNGDGTSDILWRNTTTGANILYLINSNSVTSTPSVGAIGTNWSVAEVGDFNGDGKADILWSNSTTGAYVTYLMNGASVVSTANLGNIGSNWSVQKPVLASA
jgi:hypothetical protein